MKLRVYKGTQLVSENTIIDLPTGVVALHMDQGSIQQNSISADVFSDKVNLNVHM
jgi:hypothetical protein